MIRSDREVTDFQEILSIMRGCDAASVALMDGEYPYVIPMNFGFEETGGAVTLYFHGAKAGKKLDLIRKNGRAAFCMSRAHHIVPGKVACATAFLYESVCGRGEIELLEGEEKRRALSVIMRQYDPETEHVFEEKHANAVSVFALRVSELTGKRRERK